jgi:hypothetical protein
MPTMPWTLTDFPVCDICVRGYGSIRQLVGRTKVYEL